ncbi:TetR/AcrR family transcriptional regulator [Sphingomonas jatrophae]|uniref:Transcriptional regulator, TetR family n=1 Tax=Sphingomonas jatrophae TaxID=1166337 RepID=A0A1I6KJJ3_9SPHN|nr:TetR/AcrR family transcriptional regulator [Sphingomonas jatrophae]SFR91381.1 transcriptional regulator, TetR family [Sphingomonas jatrophae]
MSASRGMVRAATAAAAASEAPSRRASNKARTTAAILDAARACIAEGGVQAMTMDQVAARAPVSRATLFNYFAGKAELIDALVESNEAGFFVAVQTWRAAEGLSIGERLTGLFAATGRYLRRATPIQRELLGISWLAWNDLVSVPRVARVLATFAGLLADARDRGEIAPDIDMAAAGEIVCNSFLGVIHAWRMDAAYPVADRLDGAARLLAVMLQPDRPAPAIPPRIKIPGL